MYFGQMKNGQYFQSASGFGLYQRVDGFTQLDVLTGTTSRSWDCWYPTVTPEEARKIMNQNRQEVAA
jgi:hypothetical protein